MYLQRKKKQNKAWWTLMMKLWWFPAANKPTTSSSRQHKTWTSLSFLSFYFFFLPCSHFYHLTASLWHHQCFKHDCSFKWSLWIDWECWCGRLLVLYDSVSLPVTTGDTPTLSTPQLSTTLQGSVGLANRWIHFIMEDATLDLQTSRLWCNTQIVNVIRKRKELLLQNMKNKLHRCVMQVMS